MEIIKIYFTSSIHSTWKNKKITRRPTKIENISGMATKNTKRDRRENM